MKRGTLGVLGLLAVVGLAFAWWVVGPRGGVSTAPDGPSSPTDRRPPMPTAADGAVRLDARARSGKPPETRTPPATLPERTPTAAARIQGRVDLNGLGASWPAASRIDVFSMGQPVESRVRRVALDPTGRFEFRLDGDGPPRLPHRFGVIAKVPGWAWVREDVDVAPGADLTLLLTAARRGPSGVLRARVLDPADQPVGGLRLLLAKGFALDGRPLPDPDAETCDADAASRMEAVVLTDADGRFELRGLSTSRLKAYALEGAWHVANTDVRALATGDYTLRARPAFVLEGLVTDAAAGTPIGDGARTRIVRVGEAGGSHWSSTRDDGRFRWCWPLPADGAAGTDVGLEAEATGYRRAVRTIRFAPGGWTRSVDVTLERPAPEEVGRLRFVHDLRDEAGRPVELHVRVRVDPSFTEVREPTYAEDGLGTMELPAGTAELGITAGWPGARPGPLEWQGTVDVAGGRTTDFRVPFPPAGTLRLRTPRSEEPRGALVLVDAQGEESWIHVDAQAETVFLPGVPAGTWRVYFQSRGEDSAVAVEVPPGIVVEATLRR